MVYFYNFEGFSLGVDIPGKKNSGEKLQILNLSMSSLISPEIGVGGEVFTPRQVHGSNIILIEGGRIFCGDKVEEFSYLLSGKFEADAVVATDKNVKIGIRTADCAPIMFYGSGVVGCIHGGWRGLREGIIQKTFEFLRKNYNFCSSKATYFILPCIHVCCYEVGREFLEWAGDFCLLRGDKVYFDIPKFIITKLFELGAKEDNIYYSPLCTCCNSDFLPSFRATKTEERAVYFIYLT